MLGIIQRLLDGVWRFHELPIFFSFCFLVCATAKWWLKNSSAIMQNRPKHKRTSCSEIPGRINCILLCRMTKTIIKVQGPGLRESKQPWEALFGSVPWSPLPRTVPFWVLYISLLIPSVEAQGNRESKLTWRKLAFIRITMSGYSGLIISLRPIWGKCEGFF